VIAGAGIDVFNREPPDPGNPLLKLENVVTAPHMAGVTCESIDRMAAQAVKNVLSVFDARPIRENIINPEVLD
jgi:D-3-phosphoglycerate dehydrogenase